MTAYYNEIDLHAAQWLRNLIKAGHIADGVVDTRSIEDVQPDDLREFTQCHFFAGIGVWSYALRAAGWPDDRPVWTGSCPCQPFSAAGEGLAFADERHLWPAFHHLIKECRPAVVLGEQVASKAVDAWIDLVHADLEAVDYTFGSVPFPSAGVGAPHIRDRNYWVAHASGSGSSQLGRGRIESTRLAKASLPVRLADLQGIGRQGQHVRASGGLPALGTADIGSTGGLANTNGGNASAERQQRSGQQRQQPEDGSACWMADANGINAEEVGARDDAIDQQRQAKRGRSEFAAGAGADGGNGLRDHRAGCDGVGTSGSLARVDGPGPTNGFWRDADWLGCTDGKWRPVEPGTFPLAHGAPARVGRLRGYGNAINAEAARVWIECVMESA